MLRNIVRRVFSTASSSSTEELRRKILVGSLLHINTSGFTEESISRACNDIGMSSASNSLIEMGPIEIVYHLLDEWDEQMIRDFDKVIKDDMSVDEKLTQAIFARIKQIQPYQNTWDEAMALVIHPVNIAVNYRRLFHFANEVCFVARDDSADVSIFKIIQKR